MISYVSLAGMEGSSWLTIILVNAVALIISASLLDGVEIKGFFKAIWVAFILSILNATLGAFLKFIMTPINLLTLGFISLLVNAAMIKLASGLISGFHVRSFWRAALLSLVLALVNILLFSFL